MLQEHFGKRLRMAASLIASYVIAGLLLEFFFVGNTPGLNPEAFSLIGRKMEDLRIGFELQTSQALPSPIPRIEPTASPYALPTAIPTIPVVVPPKPTSYIPPVFPTLPPVPTAIPTRIPTKRPPPTQKPPVIPTTAPPAPTQPKTKVTYAQFGQCLNTNGMTMYMSATCGLCTQQKKTLKDAANYVRMVDCNASESNGLECGNAGVRGLPTWGKNGKAVLVGPQSLEELARVSSCQAPQ
jgi:hypothetical protein